MHDALTACDPRIQPPRLTRITRSWSRLVCMEDFTSFCVASSSSWSASHSLFSANSLMLLPRLSTFSLSPSAFASLMMSVPMFLTCWLSCASTAIKPSAMRPPRLSAIWARLRYVIGIGVRYCPAQSGLPGFSSAAKSSPGVGIVSGNTSAILGEIQKRYASDFVARPDGPAYEFGARSPASVQRYFDEWFEGCSPRASARYTFALELLSNRSFRKREKHLTAKLMKRR